MRILVADDAKSYALLFKMALKARGHEVTIVNDGMECLDQYVKEYNSLQSNQEKKIPYDLVILDYKMPKMMGLDVAKKILNLVPKQRILIITAYTQELIPQVEKLGGSIELLNKPFPSLAMIRQVEGLSNFSWERKKKKGFKNWNEPGVSEFF